jgi:uncharacterized protein (DUF934 family)
MRYILRQRELVEDEWRCWGEEGTAAAIQAQEAEEAAGRVAVIVPFTEFQNNISQWRAYTGPLGVRLSPVDDVTSLGADIQRLSLVAAEFPGPGEGRGYSQGRLLRTRLSFKGELRAVGAGVKQDLLFVMARCGFDSFELAAGQKVEDALRAFERYTVAYQPAEPLPSIKHQRFSSVAGAYASPERC